MKGKVLDLTAAVVIFVAIILVARAAANIQKRAATNTEYYPYCYSTILASATPCAQFPSQLTAA